MYVSGEIHATAALPKRKPSQIPIVYEARSGGYGADKILLPLPGIELVLSRVKEEEDSWKSCKINR
jgi:hypothetical protein